MKQRKDRDMRNFWEIVGALIAACTVLVGLIVLGVLGALYIESNRPAPERKAEPTVLEIGE